MVAAKLDAGCPRCAGFPLQPCSFEGHPLALCPRCGGLWCDRAQWDEKVLGRRPQGLGTSEAVVTSPGPQENPAIVMAQLAGDPPAPPGVAPAPPVLTREFTTVGPSRLVCRRCHSPMTTFRVEVVQGLEIDACPQCGGVWFDQREWQFLGALREWQAEQPALNRETTFGEWLFQMFLRLPVEFNIRPHRPPVMTVLIILVCTLLVILLQPETIVSLAVHGKQTLESPQGWLTLLTHQFLHFGWFHLLTNMYLLYILGDNVEDVLGHAGFLAFYLFCGTVGGLAHIFASWDSAIPMVGASGAISGVIAAYLVLFTRARLTFMLVVFQIKWPAWVWIGLWVLLQVALAWFDPDGSQSGVAFWAHLGGFAAGLVVILPLRGWLIRRHALLYLLDTRRLTA